MPISYESDSLFTVKFTRRVVGLLLKDFSQEEQIPVQLIGCADSSGKYDIEILQQYRGANNELL